MNGIALIIAAALAFGLCALAMLLWSLGSGQYDDLAGAAERILIDDDEEKWRTGQDLNPRPPDS